ncbi:MAG: aminoacyl-tRNA hydrolase [Bacteroidales bacterium]|nr:aminoacyl-tRNA hydrolase [Lentimicrobiaceae bacterium]MDD5694935.1 aminoacyl-tRNA hydrolase [Bacteroidales bacterium]
MKYLIAGLGNIGEEYANTRHNIGFVVLDALAMSFDVTFSPDRYASVATARYKGRTLVMIKPSTYVNLSGKAIRYWLNREKIPTENLLVIVDDLALPLGQLRLRARGSDGGHNGLADIIYHLETNEFPRLRIGIGDDFARGTQVDFVLSRWTRREEEILIPRVEKAVEAIKSFVTNGVDRTMGFINPKSQDPNSK